MADGKDLDPDKLGHESNWFSNWEEQCISDWNEDSNMEDTITLENERATETLWLSFQNGATAISRLYKEQLIPGSSHWMPFQQSASCVTILYKDSLRLMQRSRELGTSYGQILKTKELIAWARKKKRHIRREDLIGFLCGRTPPPLKTRGSPSLCRSNTRLVVDRTRFSDPLVDHSEPDLQTFQDALAIQGLNGAMSNISVGLQSGGQPMDARSLGPADNFHYYILDEMSRRGDRKRTASSDLCMESPSRKRNRNNLL